MPGLRQVASAIWNWVKLIGKLASGGSIQEIPISGKMEMEVRERNRISTSENGHQAAGASVGSRTSSPLVYGGPDLPDHIPHERPRLQENGPNNTLSLRVQVQFNNSMLLNCIGDLEASIYNNPMRSCLQCFLAVFIGLFLCLVVTGASLSILTLRYKETIKQLSEEIKALDKSMQVIELHGMESSGDQKTGTCDLDWISEENL